MAVIKFSIPDAWVQENNYVYGILTGDTTRERVIKAMNESLEEWDYPISITEPDQVREMWVEPEMLLRESWNPGILIASLTSGSSTGSMSFTRMRRNCNGR